MNNNSALGKIDFRQVGTYLFAREVIIFLWEMRVSKWTENQRSQVFINGRKIRHARWEFCQATFFGPFAIEGLLEATSARPRSNPVERKKVFSNKSIKAHWWQFQSSECYVTCAKFSISGSLMHKSKILLRFSRCSFLVRLHKISKLHSPV